MNDAKKQIFEIEKKTDYLEFTKRNLCVPDESKVETLKENKCGSLTDTIL